ncbi:hypothetical protein [Bordetella genomosp. 9]|uniref:Uncharacterized protein n=1 Tax=Bordetella genomosp. 9 TaxID=1416803 RepID=A0A1W6YUY8_9BORD|nr:hypothetical protein [Bordetella genomosp. 9]ARP84907.1 hypothetical protein CAL13_00705 [Bordetella genomosp. 9]
MGREDWLRSNRHLALAAEDLKKIEAASGSEVNFKCSFDQLVRGQARRFDDAIDAEFRPKLLALKDQGAPVQDGVSRADRVLETVVPFYGVYTGIKRGDYVTAYLSFISGVVTLIPPAVAAGKLMAVGKKALFLGIQVAIGSFARRGLLKGAMLGVQYAGAYARALSIGAHAMHTASTAIDALAPGASSLLRRSYKYLRPETLRKAAAGLRGKFPGLAARLRGRAGLLNTSGMKAPLWAKPRMAAPAVPAPGGVQAPFVRAVLDNGGTQWLQRFGTAYVRLDPYRLQPAGPVLLRASDGRLSPSLEISELTRNAVAGRAMLDLLRRTPVSADGTIAVDGKTFAFIAGDYVQVEKATPFAAGGPVPWRTVPARPTGSGPQAPSTAEISTLLVYDARQGGWVSQAHHSSFQADRIGHRDGTMLPDGIVARYRISEATLRQTLASAARSGDGTIMLGGKRYAEIGGDFLEVLPDRATSTRERPIWRIAGAPLPGTRDGGPRLVWDKGQAAWRKAETVPRLQGGGGKPGTAGAGSAVTRRIDADAVKDMADRIVINPATIKPTRIADTETVRLAKTILGEATDLTHYPWWDNELDQYLDFYVANLRTSAYAKVDPSLADPSNADRMEDRIVENMRRFLKDLYARSETFRGLANYARDNGILRKDLAWVMHIVAPDTLTNGTAQTSHRYHVTVRHPDAKKIVVPDVQAPPCWTPMAVNGETKLFGAVYDGGTVGPIASPATIVHEMMHFLTRMRDPDGSSLDRGVVEYLAQRVLQESGVTQARRLTYAGWSEKPDKENLRRIEHYVRIQDEYLSKLFPMTGPPAEAWNPSAGNDRWLTADTTQPAGSQTQP